MVNEPRWRLDPAGGTYWHLWNLTYGAHTDSGDAGYIKRLEDGRFEPFTRGDVPRSLGGFDTLESAAAALKATY